MQSVAMLEYTTVAKYKAEQCSVRIEVPKVPVHYTSNYNRANDVAMCVCVATDY